MNDFNLSINGLKGVIKASSFYKKASEKERTVTIGAGPGESPALSGRKVSVIYADGKTEYINSYDLDYVIKNGKKLFHIDAQEVQDEVSSPATDPEPTGLRETKVRTVRRKK